MPDGVLSYDVVETFGATRSFQDVSLDVRRGEVLAFLGDSEPGLPALTDGAPYRAWTPPGGRFAVPSSAKSSAASNGEGRPTLSASATAPVRAPTVGTPPTAWR